MAATAGQAFGAGDGDVASAPGPSQAAAGSTPREPWAADDGFLHAIGMMPRAVAPEATPVHDGPGTATSRRPSATKLAAAGSRKLAAAIDALRPLDDAALLQRREELQAQVAQPRLPAAEREQVTREHDALELVCAERNLHRPADPREHDFLATEGPQAVRLPETRPAMRAFLERQIASFGSYREARRQVTMMLHSELTHASFATRQLGREQLELLDAEVAQFRKAFSLQAGQAARTMLDDGARAIAAALQAYGLPVDGHRLTTAAEQARDGDRADAVNDWMTLAHAGEQGARYQARAPHREELAMWVARLQRQQAALDGLAREQHRLLQLRAMREHPSHHDRGADGPRLELHGVSGMDEARRAAARSHDQLAKLPAPPLTLPPSLPVTLPGEGPSSEQRLAAVGAALRAARAELSLGWREAERRHPILAAYRSGGEPNPAAARGLLGSGDEPMKAALHQLLPKLASILRARSALTSHEISPLALTPVVELARTQMLVPPGSARAGAVVDLVAEASSGGWPQWAIAAVSLATAVISLVPSAGLSVILATNLTALALDAYGAVESYQEYGLQQALSNTALDRAHSLAAEEPSLTGLAVRLLSLGLNATVVTQLFRQAVTVRRLAAAGDDLDAAVRALNEAGKPHGLPHLGEDVAADAGAARGASRSPPRPTAAAQPVNIHGAAQSPTLTWRPNPGGLVRTPEEAVALARRWGVEIPEDIAFVAREPKYFPKKTLAEYFSRRASAGQRLAWADFLNAYDQIAVMFSRDLLSSDEAVVAVIAHEMHELNGLRDIFESYETVPATEIFRLINPGIPGNLHDRAWDVADETVARMRASIARMDAK